MTAYSFQKRFAEPILAGTKAQTVRGPRKCHARPGEELQLYTDMRTKQCRLIARATCLDVTPVRLVFHRSYGAVSFDIDGALLVKAAMENFARADGFDDVADMAAFWFAHHGRGVDEIDFRGVVVRWRPIVPAELRSDDV